MSDIVLGAGIVGIATALQLQRRGRHVVLIDKNRPGQGASFGNAGLLDDSGVLPRAFPRQIGEVLPYVLGTTNRGRLDMGFLPQIAPFLGRYWHHSARQSLHRISLQLAPLFVPAIAAHKELIDLADAGHLLREDGWLHLFRTIPPGRDAMAGMERAQELGFSLERLEGDEIARREPALRTKIAAALHWRGSASVSDPGELSRLYAEKFAQAGGTILAETVDSVGAAPSGWRVKTDKGSHEGENLIVCMGLWSKELVAPLGYRLPMQTKRGYHMHFAIADENRPRLPVMDDEAGIALSPMTKGMRMTTGVELTRRDAPANPRQVDQGELVARELFTLGGRLDNAPWLGNRPAIADMKPVIGAAPRHKHLWFGFGHAHHGLTLAAITGQVLAEAIVEGKSSLDLTPFSAARFG